MKLKHYGLLALLGVFSWSCSDDSGIKMNGGEGQIHATFKSNGKVNVSTKAGEESAVAAEAKTLSIDEFTIGLEKKDGSYANTWKVSEFPTDAKFSTGVYSMELYYGDIEEEGFDNPYYYGVETLEVIDEEVSTPSIEAKLANTMVSVAYTEAFKNYFTSYSAKVRTVNGNTFDMASEEGRVVYVKPGKVMFQLNMTKTNGAEVSIEPASIDNAAACTHYRVTFDVNGGEVGDAKLTVSFDDATVAEPIEVMLSDELLTAPAPAITTKGFENNAIVNVIEGQGADAAVSVVAQTGLAKVMLYTTSEYLQSIGWKNELDLMNLSAEDKALLQQYGVAVKGLWNNPDKMGVIDFTNLIPNLKATGESISHKFVVQVTDIYGRVAEEAATLTVNTSAIVFAMSDALKANPETREAQFTLNFTGIWDRVSFKAKNDYGVLEDAPIKAKTDNGDGTYAMTVQIPDNASSTTIVGYYNGQERGSLDVKIAMSFALSAKDYDMWATKATMTVSSKRMSRVMSNIKSVLVNDEATTNYTKDDAKGVITVNGLASGVQSTIKVVADDEGDDVVSSVVVTTEAQAQVGNAGMEEWYIEEKVKKADFLGSNKKYYTFHPYSKGATDKWWATNNDKAQGGTYALGIWYEGCFASCASYTTDVKSGSKAALIYVSGCGDGAANTSGTYVGGAMVGSMWIGNFNDKVVNQGHSFTSRPSSLSFWYKYEPYNTDAFKVVIALKNGEETIATGEYESASMSEADAEYKQATVNFNYSVTNKKATSISIQFLASNRTNVDSDEYFAKGTKISYPEVGNWTVHKGSVLKFDDLVLNY